MAPDRRYKFFRLGSTIQSAKTTELNFAFDANKAHEMAYWALEQVGWRSVKAAMALLIVGGMVR